MGSMSRLVTQYFKRASRFEGLRIVEELVFGIRAVIIAEEQAASML
jgi:hypothetical protein